MPSDFEVLELQAGDTDAVQAVFDGLSAAHRVQRFLSAMPTLPHSKLRYLASPDGRHHVAFVATRNGAPVGMARYVRVSERAAEVAVEVVDECQGAGVASTLLFHLGRNAVAQGLTAFAFTVSGDNRQVVALLARSGAQMSWEGGLLQARVSLVDDARVRWLSTPVETGVSSRG